jgi:hypothetical protein
MPPLAVPPLLILTALGAAAVGRWVVREFHRINAELDAVRTANEAGPIDRSRLQTLRRDPETGVYRPQ